MGGRVVCAQRARIAAAALAAVPPSATGRRHTPPRRGSATFAAASQIESRAHLTPKQTLSHTHTQSSQDPHKPRARLDHTHTRTHQQSLTTHAQKREGKLGGRAGAGRATSWTQLERHHPPDGSWRRALGLGQAAEAAEAAGGGGASSPERKQHRTDATPLRDPALLACLHRRKDLDAMILVEAERPALCSAGRTAEQR